MTMVHEIPETYPFWTERGAGPEAMRIGLSEGFLETLDGDLVGVDWLVRQGRVRRGDGLALLHTGGGAVDLKAPFEMEILRVNEEVARDPRRLRASSYGEGWLAEVRRAE